MTHQAECENRYLLLCVECGAEWTMQGVEPNRKLSASCSCGNQVRVADLEFTLDDIQELKGGEI